MQQAEHNHPSYILHQNASFITLYVPLTTQKITNHPPAKPHPPVYHKTFPLLRFRIKELQLFAQHIPDLSTLCNLTRCSRRIHEALNPVLYALAHQRVQKVAVTKTDFSLFRPYYGELIYTRYFTLLTYAIEVDAPMLLGATLHFGVNVDERDSSGDTPMTKAVRMGKWWAVKLLMMARADTGEGLQLAAKTGDLCALSILRGYDMVPRESDGRWSGDLGMARFETLYTFIYY